MFIFGNYRLTDTGKVLTYMVGDALEKYGVVLFGLHRDEDHRMLKTIAYNLNRFRYQIPNSTENINKNRIVIKFIKTKDGNEYGVLIDTTLNKVSEEQFPGNINNIILKWEGMGSPNDYVS